ncbi:MAG: hypothetical protein EXS12_00880 [Phycisphaerales bacterium]|nr:hypothetical protein [Phycisphaerales bacterium]
MRNCMYFTAFTLLTGSALAQNIGGDNKSAPKTPAAVAPATTTTQSPTPSTTPPDVNSATVTTPATTPPAPPTEKPNNHIKISGGYSHQFNTSIEGSGSYTADRAYFGISSRHTLTETVTLSVGVAYEYDYYNFTGNSVFALAAWNNVETLGILPRFDIKLNDHWSVGAAPVLQMSGESNASAGKTITGGALVNFRYAFDETHVLGLGLLAKGQLNNSVLVVPVPIVDWEIKKGLRISNVRGPEANPFVGLELVQELSTQFNAALGGAWEYRMFRLDDSAPLANGAGVEQQITLYGRLEWKPVPQFRVDFIAGASVMNQLKLYDSSNNFIGSEDGGTSLVLGVFASYKF